MNPTFRPSSAVLLIGDLVCFTLALWLALFLRALTVPQPALVGTHIAAFAPLFLVWVLVFFIAGLYEGRRIITARRALSATLLYAQTVNVIIAALVFFVIPLFGIAPKTVLLIYLAVSVVLVLLWRAYLFPQLGLQKSGTAVVVGEGAEMEDLASALHSAPLSPVRVVAIAHPAGGAAALHEALERYHPQWFIVDFDALPHNGMFADLMDMVRGGVRFVDARALYEDIFGRVPFSSVDDRWIARNSSRYAHVLYDPLKRAMDIIAGGILGVFSLVFYPIVIVAIKLDDGGPVFIVQERIGQDGRRIRLHKFRSMTRNDETLGETRSENKITRIGGFLRTTRIDELPQLWSIVRGDLSLIGPRPELPAGVALYENEIPYYDARHLIKPGLSGWAQLYQEAHPHHATDVEATREKLSYDLYYLKHRSLVLDMIIALKTVATMLARRGR